MYLSRIGKPTPRHCESEANAYPKGNRVYSAVVDVCQLVSKALVTEERVMALEKARISMDWSYAI